MTQPTSSINLSTALTAAAVDAFEAQLRGRLVRPDSPDYEDARLVHNKWIDVRPQLIAQCADAADVIAGVAFARAQGIDLAIRGGAHNGPGLGTCEGLVLDLKAINNVRVDPEARTATVGGGAVAADVDHATGAFGLASPFGIIGSTGVGGLTLGGGIGYLARKYGLSIDNLLSADVVLADGSLVTASETSEPDLFWALRGGGGNFGVVTSFTFKLSPVSNVLFGPMFYPIERSEEVLKAYRDFLPAAPEDLDAFFAFLVVPPAPPFPPELQMKKVCGIVVCYTGDPAAYDDIIAPMRALGPLMDGVMEMPFAAAQGAFDALYPAKVDNWYWRALFIRDLPDEAIVAHAEQGPKMPTWKSTMHLYPIDGAVRRVGKDETAFAYRDCTWAMVVIGVDEDSSKKDELRQFCVDYYDAIKPYSAGAGYVNMIMAEGQDLVEATYADNYARLRQVKAAYDPDNLFHINQNIPPALQPGLVPRVRPASETTSGARIG